MDANGRSRAAIDEIANDECALLIGGEDKGDGIRRGQDRVGVAIGEIDDGDENFQTPTTKTRLSHRASIMQVLWTRVKSIIPGGEANSGGQDDWTLDSGIIYRPNTITNDARKNIRISLNNLHQNPPRRVFNWFTGGGGGGASAGSSAAGKSHGFAREEAHNNRRLNNHDHDHYYYNLKNRYKCRMLLTLTTSLLFLVAITLILVKLMNLLHEPLERARMSQMFSVRKADLKIPDNGSGNLEYPLHDYDDIYGNGEHLENSSNRRWIVSSPKCRIPSIEPWHESIRDYVKLEPEYNCSDILITNKANGQPGAALTFVWSNKLYFSEQAIRFGEAALKDCCYKQVTRSEDNDDDLDYSDNCIPINVNDLKVGLKAPAKLIQVNCSKFNYTNVHPFVIHDEVDEDASELVAAKKLNIDQYYNVVMVGVDTVSRLNGLRQLNRTLSLLRNQFKTLEFMGYNKVGENTFPNLIPLLTGLKPEQLMETQCWLASNYSQESESGDDYLDNCKYLWSFYQELGYRTYFGEDWPAASTFNYLKLGFKKEPTNYYGRPFTIVRQKLLLPPLAMGCKSPCLWDRSIVELDLYNLRNFIQENKDRPHFAFHWINCPQHDDLNGASRIDRLLETFFNDMHASSQEHRTFVIFFSDHGYRWNNFVSTRVGHYEASLPMLTIAPPKHFIENHPTLYENLKLHLSSLLTPFDLFKTLIEIRNLGTKVKLATKNGRRTAAGSKDKRKQLGQQHRPQSINRTTTTPASMKLDELGYTIGPTASTTIKQLRIPDGLTFKQNFKTLSLLKRHNSSELDRSCIEAGIPDNYCVCHEFQSISESTKDVLGASYYLVYVHLYSTIKANLKLCHWLDLEKIHKAEVFDFGRMKSSKSISRRRRGKRDSVQQLQLPPQHQENLITVQPDLNDDDDEEAATTTDSPSKMDVNESEGDEYLPNKEYNIRFSTKPGSALFQEVVRWRGDDLEACGSEVEKIRQIIEDPSIDHGAKYSSVMQMNKVCKFSVHSDSISRLNLYRDQSKCVKNNIEVKKVCYCNDLL